LVQRKTNWYLVINEGQDLFGKRMQKWFNLETTDKKEAEAKVKMMNAEMTEKTAETAEKTMEGV
jgi:hypothetical protein